MIWTQSRSYDSGLRYTGSLGNRWIASNSEVFLVATGPGIDVIQTASAKYTFTGNDSSGYTPPNGLRLTLEHKTGDHEYWLKNIDTGALTIFHDFTVSPTTKGGKLKEFTSIAWKAAGKDGMVFSYDSSGDLLSLTTSGDQASNVSFERSNGRLTSISVSQAETLIQKVEYVYFQDVTSASTQAGSTDDLVYVKVSSRAADDGGTDLSIVRYTLYRYENGSRLKGVYDHGSVMRALAHFVQTDPRWLLTQSDDYQSSGSGPKIRDFASRWFTYYNGDLKTDNSGAGTSGDPKCLTPWYPSSGEDLQSKYGGSNRNETNFVASERVGAGQCASCGGTSGITHDYYYIERSKNDDNEVKYIIVEDTKDPTGAQHRKVYGINADARKLRDVFIDNPASSPKYWCQSWTLNPISDWSTGSKPKKRYTISEYRPPSAHNVTSSNVSQFLDPYNAASTSWTNDTNTLRTASDAAAGPTYVFTYHNEGRQTAKKVKQGYDSTSLYFLNATDYGDGSSVPADLPVTYYQYPTKTTDKSTSIQWTISYDFWDSSTKLQIKKATTTYPAITTSQNGSGVAATAELWYDKAGRLRWAKDAEGYVTYYSYEIASGQLSYTVEDVDPSSEPSGASDSSLVQWDDDGSGADWSERPSRSGLPTALALVTRQNFDDQGRLSLVTNPGGDRHATVYKSDRTIQFPYIDSSGYPQMPIQVEALNNNAQVAESFSVRADYPHANISVSGGVPTGFTTGHDPTQADYVAWTRHAYDDHTGNLTQVDTYHNISNDTGAISTNFYRTVFQYDVQGRRSYTIQQVSGAPASGGSGVEQVTQTLYDKLDRVTEVKRGVSEASGNMGDNYNNYPTLATISTTYYDDADATTPLKVGDGHVTSSTRYYGTGSGDYVESMYKRTYRGDLRGIEQTNGGTAFNPRTVMDIDWEGRTTGSAQYTSTVTWTDVLTGDGYTNYLSGHGTNRHEWTKTSYNDIGQIYRVERYPGAEGTKHFEINNYYDRKGQLVANGDRYSANVEYGYDGAGRKYQERTVLKLKDDDATYGKYTSGGAFRYVAPAPHPVLGSMSTTGDDGLIEFSHMVYDDAGDGTEQHTFELNHTDTNGIDIDSSTSYVRRSTFNWYDAANRLTTTADYGSGDGTSGSTNWANTDRPSRPGSEPAWTDSMVYNGYVHLTKFGYEASSGRMDTVSMGISQDGSDTKKVATKTFNDALSRRIAVAENYDNYTPSDDTTAGGGTNNEKDRVTKFAYNGLGQQTQITAINVASTTVNEVTKYLYEDSYDASLVTSTIYPDSTDTTSSGTDQVTMSYNLDGSIAWRTDQRGVVIQYLYSADRQLTREFAYTIPSGLDDYVQSIDRGYDSLGRISNMTAFSGNGTGTIRNQIVNTYDPTHGRMIKTEQSHSGAATTGTPAVQYAYDDSVDGSNVYTNGLRLKTASYPGASRVIYNDYGSEDGIFDRLNRIYRVRETNSSGTVLTEYSYNGTNRLATMNYGPPSVKLDLYQGTSGTYAGYDRFGRTIVQKWVTSSSLVRDQLDYTYDYAGKPMSRNIRTDLISGASVDNRDQSYLYDGLQRLTQMMQGTYSGGGIVSQKLEQDFTLDQLGNWPTFVQTDSGAGVGSVNQTRTHNAANELTAISGSGSSNWADPAYDAAGNATTIPQPASPTSSYALKYDAWNRLTEVRTQTGSLVEANQYDVLGRRILKDLSGTADDIDYYYNEQWQLLEERKGGDPDPLSQYVWHPYYIDALAVRSYDSSTGGTQTRQWYVEDANYNVTAVLNDSGSIVERYSYSPYGEVTFLNADFSVESTQATAIGNTHFYTGRELDSETGLQLNRNRFYAAHVGRWLIRDPLSYHESTYNLYEYVKNRPLRGSDPDGLKSWYGWPWALDVKPCPKQVSPSPYGFPLCIYVSCDCGAGNPPAPNYKCDEDWGNDQVYRNVATYQWGNCFRTAFGSDISYPCFVYRCRKGALWSCKKMGGKWTWVQIDTDLCPCRLYQ